MPITAKIVITILVVLWTIFLCTKGRWCLTWFHDSIWCRRGNLIGEIVFTQDGEIRPLGVIVVYGSMLGLLWFVD